MFLNVLIFTGSVLTMRTFFVIYFVVHYLYVLLQAVARPHNLSAFITGKCVLTFVLAFSEKQIPNQIIFKETRKKTYSSPVSSQRIRRGERLITLGTGQHFPLRVVSEQMILQVPLAPHGQPADVADVVVRGLGGPGPSPATQTLLHVDGQRSLEREAGAAVVAVERKRARMFFTAVPIII